MHFASQAHRDKLNFELRLKLFTTRCSSPPGETASHKPIPSLTTDPVASQLPKNSLGLEYGEG